jgi:hypothetical protein
LRLWKPSFGLGFHRLEVAAMNFKSMLPKLRPIAPVRLDSNPRSIQFHRIVPGFDERVRIIPREKSVAVGVNHLVPGLNAISCPLGNRLDACGSWRPFLVTVRLARGCEPNSKRSPMNLDPEVQHATS